MEFDNCLIEDVEYFVENLNEDSKVIIELLYPTTKDFWERMFKAQALFEREWDGCLKDEFILDDVTELFNDPNNLFKYYFEEVM